MYINNYKIYFIKLLKVKFYFSYYLYYLLYLYSNYLLLYCFKLRKTCRKIKTNINLHKKVHQNNIQY